MRHLAIRIPVRRVLLSSALVLLLVLASLAVAAPASAATVVGNGTPGSCTEAALKAAVARGGGINFNCGRNPLTITVTSLIAAPAGMSTTIRGDGLITLSGGHRTRVFYVPFGATVVLEGLTIADGYYVYFDPGGLPLGGVGGGILSYGTLTVRNSVVSHNFTFYGGGIANYGTLKIVDSSISGNSGQRGPGGILNAGRLSVVDSTFSDNWAIIGFGGAIGNYGKGSTLTLKNTTFIGNYPNDIYPYP